MEWLKKIDTYVTLAFTYFSAACFAGLFLVLLANVIVRVGSLPIKMSWYSEIVELLFAYMVMGTATVLCQKKQHFKVDLLVSKFGTKKNFHIIEMVTNFIALAFFGMLLWYGIKLFVEGDMTMTILPICKRWGYLAIPVSALFLCIYTIRDLISSTLIVFGKKPVPNLQK